MTNLRCVLEAKVARLSLGQRGKSTLPRTLGQPCQQSGPGDILLQHDPMNNHQVFGKLHSLLHTWLWDEEETPPFFPGKCICTATKITHNSADSELPEDSPRIHTNSPSQWPGKTLSLVQTASDLKY